jgi:hypothetical protein
MGAVTGYGAASIVGAEAITTTVLEMTRLSCDARNTREAFHLSSLTYQLVDPRRLTGGPRTPLSALG